MSATLQTILAALRQIAPLEMAEEWDNVGLLVEPYCPDGLQRKSLVPDGPVSTNCHLQLIERLMLTIDLTEPVIEEAIARRTQMVVSYHPPIFDAVKRLTTSRTTDRVILRAIGAGIAVYSPHTALDAAEGGVNDWLAGALPEAEWIEPIRRRTGADFKRHYKLVVFAPPEYVDTLRDHLAQVEGVGWIGNYSHCSFNIAGVGTFLGQEGSHPTIGRPGQLERVDEVRLEMVCTRESLPEAAQVIQRIHPYETPAWEVYEMHGVPPASSGQGRSVLLKKPATIDQIVAGVKKRLRLKHVRVALAEAHRRRGAKVRHIGLCAGAGGSLLRDFREAQVYLTGEMRHHDILAANADGISVILSEHTHTERGYLPTLKRQLTDLLGKTVSIDIARADREPVVTV